MKKIVYAIPTNTSGGAERVLSQIANYSAEKGYETFWVNFDTESSFYSLDTRIKVKKLGIVFGTTNKLTKMITAPFVEFKRFLAVKKFLTEEKPDAVVAFLKTSEMIFGLNCILLKIPFITSIRNDYDVYGGSLKLFRKIFYPRSHMVVCQTLKVQKSLQNNIKCKSVVIPNPLSPEAINVNNYIGKQREKKVIAVGRLCEQKNFSLLIKALHQLYIRYPDLKEYRLEIFGGGEDKDELQDLINRLDMSSSIRLMGIVPNALACNNAASLYVMSSNYEGFPNTLAEAMANGIPSITTDFPSGAGKELIGENERGLIINVGDCDGLVDAIAYVLHNPAVANVMAEKAFDNMKQYKKEEVCERWLHIITK